MLELIYAGVVRIGAGVHDLQKQKVKFRRRSAKRHDNLDLGLDRKIDKTRKLIHLSINGFDFLRGVSKNKASIRLRILTCDICKSNIIFILPKC